MQNNAVHLSIKQWSLLFNSADTTTMYHTQFGLWITQWTFLSNIAKILAMQNNILGLWQNNGIWYLTEQ